MLNVFSGVAVLLALLGLAAPACAGTLLTGAIRDEGGVAIGGARVSAFDRAGRVLGTDIAIADGTFALDVSSVPASITVSCMYCRPATLSINAAGEPLVVIVHRFTAVAQSTPAAADIRALPYRSAADVASLRPFTVVDAGRISDRGLDVYGATLVNGLPFYSPADGDNYSRLVPAHAVAALDVSSPIFAPLYGGYASAGVYDVRLRDLDSTSSRLDGGNAVDLVARADTNDAAALYSRSNDAGNRREAAGVDVNVPFAGGGLALDAVAFGDDASHGTGAGIAYSTDSRRYTTAAALRATQTGDASLLTADARVRNHGPLALEFGVRATRASAVTASGTGFQADNAVFADATRAIGAMTATATLAADRGSDTGAGADARDGALVGSIGSDIALNARWNAHSGIVSNLRLPAFARATGVPRGFAVDRSLLFEQSVTYTDLRRLRITGIAYTQRTTGPLTAHVNGIGIDAGWQIAPFVSVRTWQLRANQSAAPAYGAPPSAYGPFSVTASALTRQLAWFTYDHGLRVDALARSGALEGDVRVPLGAQYELVIGSATYNSVRTTTIGVSVH